MRRLRILMSAYACEPGKGSEEGVGWTWATEVSRFADVWVITRSPNRESIERALAARPKPNVHFVYTDVPGWPASWQRSGRNVRLHHYIWQMWALVAARRLHRAHRFDLVQHVTFGTLCSPSLICLLPAPFIWGPILAIDPVPRGLRTELGLRGRLFQWARETTHALRFRLDPFISLARSRSAMILCKTTESLRYFRRACPDKQIVWMTANGDPRIPDVHARPRPTNGGLRVLAAGRLVAWKGFSLAVKAFARFHERHPDSTFEIVGDGPQLPRLKGIAASCGVADAVTFHGRLPRGQTLERLAASDVFLFTSMLDAAASAPMEAMAMGKPVVCLDHGGPGDLVTAECGIKVEPRDRGETVRQIAAALKLLADSPELRARMGQAGKRRIAEHYGWDGRRRRIQDIYSRVVEGRAAA
ncbi:MAG TPA: glycosyltransferase [Phycisphaerae bacterium]|nr:glycosyltransferase [Phycisphaerae bacterium]HUT59458.1 glycosyltransferase [Phycisphaerae bacterium]